MKRLALSLIVLALAAPAFAQSGLAIGNSTKTQKPPTLAEARECASATGYWVVMRRAAKQSAKIYENSLHGWAAYIQKQTNETETKVEADISAAVQARAKSRDASQTLNTLVACAAFERPPGPPTLGDQPTP